MTKYAFIQEHMGFNLTCMVVLLDLLFYKTVDGAQPIALFNSLDKSCEFFGDLGIPNHYDKTEIDATDDELPALVSNTYTKTEAEALISNISLTGSENIDITNNQFHSHLQ